jgi:hypothetical protein
MIEDIGGSVPEGWVRWSYALARPPGWLTSAEASVVDWYKQRVFDRGEGFSTSDELERIERAFIAEADRLGVRADAGSANNLLNAARLDLGLTSWAQIAGSAGSAAPTGAGALSAPLLDVIAANDAARIRAVSDAISLSGGNPGSGDDVRLLAAAAAMGITPARIDTRTTFAAAPSPVGAGNLSPRAVASAGFGGPMMAPISAGPMGSFEGGQLPSGGNNLIIWAVVIGLGVWLLMDR